MAAMNDVYLLKKGKGQAALEWIHDGIFPNKCLFCRKVLEDLRGVSCEICGNSALFLRDFREGYFENIDDVYVAYDYDLEVAREVVMRLKYGGKKLLARKMAQGIFDCFVEIEADCFVCVPLPDGRLKERGYNQAALLAMELAGLYGMSAYDGLARTRETAKQFDLGPKERAANVAGAFAVKDGFCVEGKRVVLVDDVLTTGATAMECARVLAQAGARCVGVMTFAAVG